MAWPWVDTEYSIHRVQHMPSTAFTQDCLSSFHSHNYQLTPECRVSFRHASLHDRPPSASSLRELICKVTLSHSHGCKLTNWWIESQHRARHPSTASKYSSNLTRSRPPSVYPNSVDYGLQFHTNTASKCISEFTRSWPPSASLSSLDLGLQVQFSTRSITASKYIVYERRQVYGDTGVSEDNHCLLPVKINRV